MTNTIKTRTKDLNNTRYSQYLKSLQKQYYLNKNITEETTTPSHQPNDASVFERIGDTIGDFAGNVVSGFTKGLEGIYDFGASIVGGIGGIFSKDFQDSVKEHVSYDWTGNNISNPLNEWFDDSYLNDSKFGNFVENVASGVGQMLPAVIVTVATGGAGAGAFITPGMATMGASAMGNATESAFNDGASYGQGLAYGVVGGAVEMATEKIGGKLFGNSAIDDALGLKPATKTLFKGAKTGVGKAVQGAIGEGIEEGMAELVNPLTKTIYKGTEALNEYKDKEFWGRVGESAAVGAATSIAFGETVGRINRNTNNANETLAELKSLEVKEDNLHARGKLFEGGNEQKINNLRTELRAELSQTVSKMSEKTRAKYIEQNNLGSILNEDGSLKVNSAQLSTIGAEGVKNGLASVFNKQAYSPRYYGNEDKLLIKPTTQQLSQENRDALLQINKLNKGKNRVSTVFVDSGEIEKITGNKADAIEHKGVIYIDKNANAQKVLATHEFTHTLEGTKEYNDYAKYILKNILESETLSEQFGKVDNSFNETFSRYRSVFIQKYGDLSKVNAQDYQQIMDNMNKETLTELVAQHTSEKLFTDENVIDRLSQENKSLVKKILDWIKTKLNSFKIKNKAEQETFEFLKRAESLYEKALEKVKTGLYVIDKQEKLSYSINNKNSKRIAKYIPYNKVGENNIKFLRNKLKKLFSEVEDGIADGIALENGNTIYVVDSGKDNGELSFGVRKQIVIKDEQRRNRYINNINEESYERYHGERTVFKKLGIKLDNDSRSIVGRESGKELSVDSRESINNERRISKQDADRRGSLKENIEKIKTTWGEGYNVDGIEIKDYNLINLINDTNINKFNSLLKKLESVIKNKESSNNDKTHLRLSLFETLQQQEGRVYSKLIEINNALNNTQNSYYNNNTIDIKKEFIKNLGYNGVFINEKSKTGFKSVVYDLELKKENLLDYSKDRALERLDKAIKLFGETNNPKKAGWLLTDGRFVDYNRDSSSILSENANVVLDYQDHWQIEKVYDSRRGTDAIDAFMAEGNIRLMPEGNGIEIRNKPTYEQTDKLVEYIDAVIGDEGITIDLRLPNTTENVLPNYIFYDATTDAKTIINDINSFYSRGSVSKTINGVKFSLSKTIKGIDKNLVPSKLQNAIIDYVIKDTENHIKAIKESIIANQKNIELAKQKGLPQDIIKNLEKHLEELKNEERQSIARQKETKQITTGNVNVGENSEWNIDNSYTERIQSIQEEFGLNENEEAIEFLVDVIKDSELYNEYKMGDILSYTEGLPETIKLVDDKSLPIQLQEIKKENADLGIRSWFFINDGGDFDVDGFLAPDDYNNRIFIVLNEKNPNIIAINRHERTHYFQRNYQEEYSEFVKDLEKIMTQTEKDSLYDKYFNIYQESYRVASMSSFETRIWNEVYAQIYALNEKIKDINGMYNAIEKFEQSIKKSTELQHDIKYSLSKDSEGNSLTEAQIEFFKDSKVRDAKGNLLVVYHGTDAEFNVFDISKSVEGNNAFWFSKSREYAQEMALVKNGKRVESFYLNIKNPLVIKMSVKDFADNVKEYKHIKEAVEKNKDGVIFEEEAADGDIFYAVFNANQIKSITNLKPTLNSNDIRYSLSRGQVAKLKANYAHPKVYSREDADRTVNEILSSGILEIEDKFGSMRGKTKAETIDKMFETLNKVEPGYRADLVRDMAEFIVNNATYEDIYDNGLTEESLNIYETIKEYRGKLDLSNLKNEIYHRYDTNTGRAIIMQWGTSKGGQGVDAVAQELQDMGIQIDSVSDADIFFEIVDLYTSARNNVKNKIIKYNAESFQDTNKQEVINQVVREIYLSLEKFGEHSKYSERIEKYTTRIKQLSERIKENYNRYKLTNSVLDKVQSIKDWKLGNFVNASKYKTEIFKSSIEELSKIKSRGNINKSGIRRILSGLNDWYNKENPLLSYIDDINTGYYNEEIKLMLQGLSVGTNELSIQELSNLDNVLKYFKRFLETYNKIYRNNKFIDALPIAQKHIEKIKENKSIKVGWLSNVFNKAFNNSKASYLQTFADPMTVARHYDKYENGFYTEMINRLRDGSINASVMEMEIREQLDEFLNKHKNFGKDLKKRTIKYENYDLPAQTAFLLYMTLNRGQAQLGLANAGFSFEDMNGNIQRVPGFNKEGFTTSWLLDQLTQSVKTKLFNQFTDVEKEYISIAEKIFNEDCKEAKRKTDELRTGYSNVSEDYYVPIHRANISKSIDNNLYNEMDRVSNASFNKNIVKGAKGELFINSLDKVLDRHIRAVSQYANLSTVIEEFDILYNLDIMENANKPISVKTESANIWKEGNTYFKNLISDIQGIPRGESNKIVSFLRSGFAKYQLGANPKVWATQFSSFFASSSILDYNSIVKGFAINSKDVDKYCKLAKLRNYDNSAVLAQGVLDKVDKVGDFLMKPIGKTDRLVIKKLFGACQVQVEKNSGLKIGTEENKVKAGKLLTKVILETQQNSLATERSNAMRSSSEFMKAITMFTSDAMKVVGRFIDSVGEYSILKAKIKQTTDPQMLDKLKSKLKTAKTKVVKSSTALLSSSIFMALIAQAFKWLYNKNDDDEKVAETIIVDAFGNMLGGLPLIKDIYARLVEGYELNNYAYSAINDVLDSFNNLINFEDKKPAQVIRSLVYSIGQVLGLPAKNIYNIVYGLTSRVSEETGYKMNDLFYKQNYSSDLKKAIENDDDSMIETIVDLMLNQRVGEVEDEKTRKTISELIKKGYSVLPKSVSSTITYDGETIELTKRQKENFTKIYSQANTKISSLTNGKDFEDLPSEVKAKSIKYIYDYYYEEALKDLLGVDSDEKKYLFAQAIDITELAMIESQVSQIVADTNDNGKTVSGSRKAKIINLINSMKLTAVQKYMLMGYFGYKNKNGERQVKSYIQSLKLTKTEKETLFAMCGY